MFLYPFVLPNVNPVQLPFFEAGGQHIYGDQFSADFSNAFAVGAYGPEFATAFSSAFPSSQGHMFDDEFSNAFE